jgi:hypothetical protein
MDPVAMVMEKWRSEPELKLFPPATELEIREFERCHNVRLPDDLRDFYRAANGFAPPHELDQNGFCFWPLARVCPIATFDSGRLSSADTKDCFVFADYLLQCWAYAFRLTSSSSSAPVCIVGTVDGRPRWIARDFWEFAELYVRDDELLYRANDPQLLRAPS